MRYILAVALVFVCVVGAFAGTANLTWTDNIANEQGFYIERATGACTDTGLTFTKIGEAAKDAKTYVDNTAVDGNKYCYRVRAWNLMYANDPASIQFGTWSNIAGKDFPLAGPAGTVQLTVN